MVAADARLPHLKQTDLSTNIRTSVFDLDQSSGYPSNTVASNLSRETTASEIIDIENIPREKFKDNNMNILYGAISGPRYARDILNAPTYDELLSQISNNL